MTLAANLLETIVAATRRSVEARARRTPIDRLLREAVRQPAGTRFHDALRHSPAPRVIAECKRRSPSRGILRRDYDPAAHATAYAKAGAAAISILTEPTFFDGSLAHLDAVRDAVDLPLLRKDFIVCEYQLAEAVRHGADAVLLIVGALEDAELRALSARAAELGLATLVEVHDVDELARALDAGSQIVGVNSRDLRTLAVDLTVLDAIVERIPRGVTAVAESGIRRPEDISRLSERGYHAFLVGERLIAERDPGAALAALRAPVAGSVRA
ncbi:MAG TPA: indole-3-glycerol phosphate synthase TrpC [Vicinamibacterales bacterium]|nr:indole-3-glycerol phosphate synthase TrpC [Vicinamibacterales bacterium]